MRMRTTWRTERAARDPRAGSIAAPLRSEFNQVLLLQDDRSLRATDQLELGGNTRAGPCEPNGERNQAWQA